MMRPVFLLLLAMALALPLWAQQNPVAQLKINQQLPAELLKSRSVVIVDLPQQAGGKKQGWEATAKELHQSLRNIGVDPIAYYELGNVLSGPDAIQGFFKDFHQREIQNVIFLHRTNGLSLTVAPLGKKALVDPETPAWQSNAATPAALVEALYLAATDAKLHMSNFLIPETPEFFYTTELNIKKRFFSYPLDLKFDKMAVPAYPFFGVTGSETPPALESVMGLYPYQWGVTEAGTAEDVLRMKQGYQYVLLYLHSRQENIRRLLNYAPSKEAPLELQAGEDSGEPVYKFYIRHIATGDVYAGSRWDAAPDWQTALNNFLQGLRKDQAANIK